ncbi:sigma-70 family RNA polymerase sigma factor [Paenibacillus guangzhouensis]|uniref:sigma-70 family RNA polymerase sigma factor n=1 Tax=Paenibacillus guangzhouensis TaxID=1473112 RepID=UPI0012677F51|nr:sigma-70 family RNA polymerase sigma factor [Paenibacillus guangzhouensis]
MISMTAPDRNEEPDLQRLISDYGNSLLRMCFLYLKDIRLAEDAVQDTFVKVYTSYSQFEGKSSEKTWIMRIAINICKNYLRSSWWRRIDGSVILENIPAEVHDVEDDTLLYQIIKLSSKYKEVLLLYYYQDMKIREIAEVLQIPESTVAVRLKRARESLKGKLKGWCEDA